MSAPLFGRLVTAMVTPFDVQGELDLDGTQRLARHLVDSGSDSIFVAGTTGESPTLSDAEKLALFRAVVEGADGAVKVLAGTGTNDTAHSVEVSQRAAKTGVDGLVAVTPYYNRPPQRGLEAHSARSRMPPNCRSSSTTSRVAPLASSRRLPSASSLRIFESSA